MNDREEPRQAQIPAGLCDTCRFVRIITSDRGSRFVMCELSKADPRFRRYPALPVLACDGYTQAGPDTRAD
jgi:hypothetical protein